MLKNYPIKMLGRFKPKINDEECNITPGIQKVFTDTSYNSTKSMKDTEKLVFRDLLQKTEYYNRIPTKGRMSSRDNYIRNNLDDDVRRILILDNKLKGRGNGIYTFNYN